MSSHPAHSTNPSVIAEMEATVGLTVVTPTYVPDRPLFDQLHRSVLANFGPEVRHVAVVPDSDVGAFERYRGPRCDVLPVSAILPKRLRALPFVNGWVNFRHPFPPVRGWIMQQLVKLAMADLVTADLILVVDSDVVFVRPVSLSTFTSDGVVNLYKQPDAVDSDLPRHVVWHRESRKLLGIPAPAPPFADYIAPLVALDRRLVLALRERLETVNGREWIDVLSPMRHLSEWTLYGVFVEDHFGHQHPATTERSLCHSYWDPVPMGLSAAISFVDATPHDDVAVMISAKSGTSLEVRRMALSRVLGA